VRFDIAAHKKKNETKTLAALAKIDVATSWGLAQDSKMVSKSWIRTPGMNDERGTLQTLGILAFVIFVIIFICSMVFSNSMPWDFKCYYIAVQACKLGLDPYDVDAVSKVAGEPVILYVYPPHVLYLMRPFTWFNIQTAANIFFVLKLISGGLLIYVWWRMFNFAEHTLLFLWFATVGLNATLLYDIRAGNLYTFEQLAIWAGFWCYLKGRTEWFCAAIVYAASIKITPLILLGFLLTSGKRRDLIWLGISVVAFAGVMGLNVVLWPELTHKFFAVLKQAEGERGALTPSTWSFIRDAALWSSLRPHVNIPSILQMVTYATLAGLACLVTSFAVRRTWAEKGQDAQLWRISLACLLYAIIIPRIKNYGFIVVIAPIFFVLINARLPSSLLLAVLLLMVPTYTNYLMLGKMFEPIYRTFLGYSQLLFTALIWGLCCFSVLSRPLEPESKPSNPTLTD
jgi:hypothetical protein